jgi:DNA-binding CsgD family transcriptional regulator
MIESLNELFLKNIDNVPNLSINKLNQDTSFVGLFQMNNFFEYLFDNQSLNYIWLSDSVEKFCGCSKNDITARMVFNNTHPDDVKLLANYEAEISEFFLGNTLNRTGYKVVYSFRLRNKHGDCFVALRQFFFFKSVDNPNSYYRYGIITDISDFYKNTADYVPIFKIINLETNDVYSEIKHKNQEVKTCPLSNREKEITYYINTGLSSQEIADKLFVSYETIKTHRKNIYKKLNCNNDVQLIKTCLYNQWIDLIYR